MALSAPQQQSGDQLNPADIENHTLIVIPTEWSPDVPTEYSKVGETSPCIRANVADLSAVGGVPVIYRGVMWWNAFLQGGLKRQIGQTILARMTQGQKSPGKNAPWQLLDVMAETEWVAFAESWLATPEGREFEQEGQREALGATQASVSGPAAATPAAAPPPPPPAPAGPPATPAGPPVTQAPPAAPAAPPAPAAPAPAPGAGDPMAMLAAMPEEERAKFMAALANQGQAAH